MCIFELCKEKRRDKDELDLSSIMEININDIKMFATLHNKSTDSSNVRNHSLYPQLKKNKKKKKLVRP